MTPTLLQLRHTAHTRLHHRIRTHPHQPHDGLLYGVTPNAAEWSVHTATLSHLHPLNPASSVEWIQAYQRGLQDGWQAAIGYRRGLSLKLLGVWQYRPHSYLASIDVRTTLQRCPYPFDVAAPTCVDLHLDIQGALVPTGYQFAYDGVITLPVDLS